MQRKTEIEMLSEFMEGINSAIAGVNQMVHHRINPKFMAIRDMLNIVLDKTKKMVKEGIK